MATVIQFPDTGEEPLTETVSGEVRALMGRYGVSQAELAERIGFHQTAVSKRLRGETEWKLSEVGLVAAAFNVHPATLMGGYAEGPRTGPGEGLPLGRARRYSKPQPSDPKVVYLAAVA